MQTQNIKETFAVMVKTMQNDICEKLEEIDGGAFFKEDNWQREEGGGGITRVIANGSVFEKGGVNTSEVYGPLSPAIATQLKLQGESFYATGISLVIHPENPYVPTVHGNFRYFEVYDKAGSLLDSWFGGGGDLTPYYLFEDDAKLFHSAFYASCANLNDGIYSEFKKNCDDYFVNYHRSNERRGIGGIFYDHQRPGERFSALQWAEFARDAGTRFIDAYIEIVKRRKNNTYHENERHWQNIRRGRYVEFNLLHDRGTIFGLKSGGRTESILMSLPPHVQFDYNYNVEAGSREEQLVKVLMNPREWL